VEDLKQSGKKKQPKTNQNKPPPHKKTQKTPKLLNRPKNPKTKPKTL